MPDLKARSKQPTAVRARKQFPPLPVPPNWYVNGVRVVGEAYVFNLPHVPLRGYTLLTLEDGTTLFRCRDCKPDVTGSRGDLMAHRNKLHGARVGKRSSTRVQLNIMDELLPEPINIELPPDEQELPDTIDPQAAFDMTIGELMALAPSIKAMGDLVDRLEAERDAAVEELNQRSAHDKENAHKINSYDQLREEITDLRLVLHKERYKIENYDDVRKEVLALREWKKKITNKLRPLGFTLSEED